MDGRSSLGASSRGGVLFAPASTCQRYSNLPTMRQPQMRQIRGPSRHFLLNFSFAAALVTCPSPRRRPALSHCSAMRLPCHAPRILPYRMLVQPYAVMCLVLPRRRHLLLPSPSPQCPCAVAWSFAAATLLLARLLRCLTVQWPVAPRAWRASIPLTVPRSSVCTASSAVWLPRHRLSHRGLRHVDAAGRATLHAARDI